LNTKSLLLNMFKVPATTPQFLRNRLHWIGLSLFCSLVYSQQCLSQTDTSAFKSGNIMLTEPKLSGNFGELRSNHFHSGIDFKTDETEGLPVFAPCDGYVSRVKVSRSGYGKALYINHPGGVTSVYGHLRAFYPSINDTVTMLQQQKKVFDVELFPDSTLFKVTAGQLIGFSGNTGSSQGPHVHFETRHTLSERPFNPELAGYQFSDTIPPVIKAVVIYVPVKSAGLAFSERYITEIDAVNILNLTTNLSPSQNFFVGFEGYDLAGVEENNLGIRAYRLKIGDSTVFSCRIDSFLFDETRFVNALIDYPYWMQNRRKFTLCHKLPGNELPFLGSGDGMLTIEAIQSKPLFLEAEDFKGNKTVVELNIVNASSLRLQNQVIPSGSAIKYGVATTLKESNYRLKTQSKSFYEDVILDIRSEPDTTTRQVTRQVATSTRQVTWRVAILPDNIAINQPLELSIKVEPEPLVHESKYVLARVDSAGNLDGYSGVLKDGWLTGKIRNTGIFTVVADTIAPILMEPYFADDVYTGNLKLVLPFQPDLSGITDYKCLIDEKWVCGEFNTARNSIEIFFPGTVAAGYSFKLEVKTEDRVGNIFADKRQIVYGNNTQINIKKHEK